MNRNLSERKYVVIAIFVIVAVIFIVRLLILQLFDDSYILSAENNVLRKITIYPNRGRIYDRNGELLVYDEAAYDLLVIPRQVKELDTAEFCHILNIPDSVFKIKMKKAKKYSRYKPSIFLEQISKQEFGYLEEKLYKFPGFYVQTRSLRKYNRPIAAHTLGYIGEVNNKEMKADSYYHQGDYIGKSGIEKFFEKELRGNYAQFGLPGAWLVLFERVDEIDRIVLPHKGRSHSVRDSRSVSVHSYGRL